MKRLSGGSIEKTDPANIKGCTFRHYKNGKDYEVLDVALHTETGELLVVYRPLYQTEYALFARPYDVFIEEVETDGKKVSRFQKIE